MSVRHLGKEELVSGHGVVGQDVVSGQGVVGVQGNSWLATARRTRSQGTSDLQ